MSTTALAFALAIAAPAYPLDAILSAFGDVCLTNSSNEELKSAAEHWEQQATMQGWAAVNAPKPDQSSRVRNNSYRAYHSIKALNYDLFSSFLSLGTEEMRGSVYRKNVGGRDVYLSVLAIDADNPTLAECRLFDPLGDGIRTAPIGRSDIEHWIGKPVKVGRGWYQSTQFTWPIPNKSQQSIRLHFGFKGKPLGQYGAEYDPYALYGLMIVRSDLTVITVG